MYSFIDPGKFLDFVSRMGIILQPVELFMAHGVITKDIREQAKKIQQGYKTKGIIKELKDIYAEDCSEEIREKCLEVLSISLSASLSLAKESREKTNTMNHSPSPIVSQQKNTSSKAGDILNVPAKLRL